jgi:hypothetical protein
MTAVCSGCGATVRLTERLVVQLCAERRSWAWHCVGHCIACLGWMRVPPDGLA